MTTPGRKSHAPTARTTRLNWRLSRNGPASIDVGTPRPYRWAGQLA